MSILDIDGVLNTSAFLARSNVVCVMDPVNVRELIRIISETGCSVVISSSWRTGQWTDGKLNPDAVVHVNTRFRSGLPIIQM